MSLQKKSSCVIYCRNFTCIRSFITNLLDELYYFPNFTYKETEKDYTAAKNQSVELILGSNVLSTYLVNTPISLNINKNKYLGP